MRAYRAALGLLCSASAVAELVLDVDSRTFSCCEKWTDKSGKGNDVVLEGAGWADIYRTADKDFMFGAPQSSLVMAAKTPAEMGVTEEWTLEASFAPDAPWSGFMSLLSCVNAAGEDIFNMYIATDVNGVTFLDFMSKGFAVSTTSTSGFPHISLGKFEETVVTAVLAKDPVKAGDYTLCVYENGLAGKCQDISGADFNGGMFDIAKCSGLTLNQEQDTVRGGYNAQESYRGKLFGVKVYNSAIDIAQVQADFREYNGAHGVCREGLEVYYDAGLASSYTGCTAGATCPTELVDLSGKGRHGAVHAPSGAKYWQPYHGGVFEFPDTGYASTDYIELNGAALQAMKGSYTVEMVVSSAAPKDSQQYLSSVVASDGKPLMGLHAGVAADPTTGALRECPDGWSYYETHCYKVVPAGSEYTAAEATCGGFDATAHLLSLGSKGEFQFVRGLATKANVAEMWVGARRATAQAPFLYEDGAVLTPLTYFPLVPDTANSAGGTTGLLAEYDFVAAGAAAGSVPGALKVCATGGSAAGGMCLESWGAGQPRLGEAGLYLDGTSAVLAPLVQNVQERTLEVWVKGTEGLRSYDTAIVGLTSGASGSLFDVLAPGENDGGSWAPVSYVLYAGSSDAGMRGNMHGQPLHGAEWVHAVLTYNPAGNEVVAYLNGQQYGKAAVGAVREFTTGHFLSLGRRSAADPLARSFKGLYAKAALWSRALTAAEVAARFAAGNRFDAESTHTGELCAKMVGANSASGPEAASPSVFTSACNTVLPFVCKEAANDLKYELEPGLSSVPFTDHVLMQIGVQYDADKKQTTLLHDGKQVQWLPGVERPVHTADAKGWVWNAFQGAGPSAFSSTPMPFRGHLVSIRAYSRVLGEQCLQQNWDATRSRFHVVSKGLLVHYDARSRESYPATGKVWKDIHLLDGAAGAAHDATLYSPVVWNHRHSGCFDSHPSVTATPSPIALGHEALQLIDPAKGYTVEYRLESVVEAGRMHEFNFVQDAGGNLLLTFRVNGDTGRMEVLGPAGTVLDSKLSQPVTHEEVLQFGFVMLPGGRAQTYKNGVASEAVDIGTQVDVSKATAWYANALPGSGGHLFLGCIVDVRVYDHPLTYNEMEQNFGECAVCKSETCECNLCDNECAKCKDGWIGGPDGDCRVQCDASFCNNHGVGMPNGAPSIRADECVCACSGHWTGVHCEVCPSNYDQLGCDACAPGRFDYPVCGTCASDHCQNGAKGEQRDYQAGDLARPFQHVVTASNIRTVGIICDISDGYKKNNDVLRYGGSRTDLSVSWQSSTGILRITRKDRGTDTVTAWNAVLNDLVFQSTSSSTQARRVLYAFGTAFYAKATGHLYEFYAQRGITWQNAQKACRAKKIVGRQGYLTTITSSAENSIISAKLAGHGWAGAADSRKEGEWRWV